MYGCNTYLYIVRPYVCTYVCTYIHIAHLTLCILMMRYSLSQSCMYVCPYTDSKWHIACVYSCTYNYVHMCVYVCSYAYVHVHVFLCYVHSTFIHTYDSYLHMYVHTYICTCIHDIRKYTLCVLNIFINYIPTGAV